MKLIIERVGDVERHEYQSESPDDVAAMLGAANALPANVQRAIDQANAALEVNHLRTAESLAEAFKLAEPHLPEGRREQVRRAVDKSGKYKVTGLLAQYLDVVRGLTVQLKLAQADEPKPKITLADSRKGRVYIAGPMTGIEDLNFPAFNHAADTLRDEGLHVENPADHGVVDGAEWADHLRYDLGRLASCESLALLPGWGE